MPALNLQTLEAMYDEFVRILNISQGTCTRFSQSMWAHWQGQPQYARVCQVVAFRWLLFRAQGQEGFVAHIMQPGPLAQLQQDITTSMSFAQRADQYEYTEREMAAGGLPRVWQSPPLHNHGQNLEFLVPLMLGIPTTAGRYSLLGFAGQRRSNGDPIAHTIAIDGVRFVLFDPEAGFATFRSMSQLSDGLYRWMQYYHSFMDVRTCNLRAFGGTAPAGAS
jgi:hypothetical protein